MPRVDWTPPAPRREPGCYEVEIGSKIEEKVSRKGDAYLRYPLMSVEDGEYICHDMMMLEGPGRGIGQEKLKALGFDESTPAFETHELIGKRVFAQIYERAYKDGDGNPKKALDVNIEAGPHKGYWPHGSPPQHVTEMSDSQAIDAAPDSLDIDDTPF